MGVVLALLSALCYGSSYFVAGAGGRRSDPTAVTVIAQPFGLVAAAVADIALSGRSPTLHALWWGALCGVGSGGGGSLYRGLAVARMSVIGPLSAVLSAALPAVTGLIAGTGFARLLIALDRAGASAGAWPPLPGTGGRRADGCGLGGTGAQPAARKTWSQA